MKCKIVTKFMAPVQKKIIFFAEYTISTGKD